MAISLAVLSGLIVLYTVVAKKLDRLSITMPIVFVLIGAVAGSQFLGLIEFPIGISAVELFIELTLALLIFADASSLNFNQIRSSISLPGRLLLIGFPLTMALGALIAFLFFPGEGIGFALLLGAVLAPSDASLGLPIFNNPKVPAIIRQALNVEGGLNDGLAAPLVTLFLALNLEEESFQSVPWLSEAVIEIGSGVLVGILAGILGGWLFNYSERHGNLSEPAKRIGNIALGLFTYYGALAIGGNGFVAAFTSGILFAFITRGKMHEATEYTEITGSVLSVFVWTTIGAGLVIPLFQQFDLKSMLYGLISLTLVRMIPVALAMIGTKLRKDTILIMGWLGPRGLASIVFMLITSELAKEAGVSAEPLITVVSWTVLMSVFLHGLGAVPLANWYARRLQSASPEAIELQPLPGDLAPQRMPRLSYFQDGKPD